jgi:hypothetical protein
MKSPRDFHAREGQPIIPVLRRFVRYVLRDARVTITGDARIMKTEQGRRVIYDPAPQSFPGSFRIALPGGNRIRVGEGLVSGLVPYLDGRRIDGLDEEGEPDPKGVPTLLCEPFEDKDRSYVVLFASHTEEGEVDETIVQDSGDPAVVIVHLEELPPGMREEGRVARLLAVLYWQGEQIRSVRQVAWFDQEIFPSGGKARMRAAA